ncbi:hypothetical protein [Kineococcus gypseus]
MNAPVLLALLLLLALLAPVLGADTRPGRTGPRPDRPARYRLRR